MVEPTNGVARRRRRQRLRASLAIAAVFVTLAAGAAAVGFGGSEADHPKSPSRAFTLVKVTQDTLVDYVTVDGTVSYGPATPLGVRATGTVTWLPSPGTVVNRGQVLARVDDKPIVLLYGTLPMYRPLAERATGADVEQFEKNLRTLGYSGFTVDDTFSASTTAAVKRWQHDLHLPETGVVETERVVYASRQLRVQHQLVRVSAAAPADVLDYTGTTKLVTATLEPAAAGWAAPGAAVTVRPEGAAAVAGIVQTVSEPQPTAGDSASQNVGLTITVADQNALADVERGSVEVRHAMKERTDVLTVPVGALLALAEGGYGLEIVDAGEAARIVAVQTGMFAAGRVEVTGPGLHAGLTVRMPT